MKDSFGSRMKSYENMETNRRLMKLLPIYCRVDGICFHNFCKDLKKPYDQRLSSLMIELAIQLAKEFNANCAYTQSDEISLGWYTENYESEAMCGGKIMKFNSHVASKTSVFFNNLLPKFSIEKEFACFDSRIINLPNLTETTNMFLWRELDATRNSIQMAGHAYFSQKRLHGKKRSEIQEMLFQEKQINWNDYPEFFRRGTYIIRKKIVSLPDVSKIPEKHRHNIPNIPVERNEFMRYDMPPLSKVINREKVLFFGEDPILEHN